MATARKKATAGKARARAAEARARPKAPAKSSRSTKALSLELDAGIYDRATLERASAAFGHLARIAIRKVEGRFVVSFQEIDPDVAEVLPDEFANFALGCLAVSP